MFRYAPRGQSNHFNPLPSCEGRQDQSLQARVAEDFNPLPSCEGRLSFADALLVFLYFNPLPSCEGRRFCLPAFPVANNFNPLPSCEGRHVKQTEANASTLFQSTPLMRGETQEPSKDWQPGLISIHSPHARGDWRSTEGESGGTDFNPLPSCEGRQVIMEIKRVKLSFQSTPLMRGETIISFEKDFDVRISIHSPHARGDPTFRDARRRKGISIHSPHARGDAIF